MDSIKPEYLEGLSKLDTTIIRTPDQNQTDYTKALAQLQFYATSNNIHVILSFAV